MLTVAFIFHILVCLAIVGLVMLQQGKGADLGAALGGSSQSFSEPRRREYPGQGNYDCRNNIYDLFGNPY